MKKLQMLIVICFLGVSNIIFSQNKEVVIIEVWESISNNTSRMYVIHPNDSIEIIELNKYSDEMRDINNINSLIVKKQISKWLNEGFEITATYSSNFTERDNRNKYFIILTR